MFVGNPMKNKHHEMIFTPFKDKLRNNITGSNCVVARCFIFTTPKVSLPAYRSKKMAAQIKCPTQEWFLCQFTEDVMVLVNEHSC